MLKSNAPAMPQDITPREIELLKKVVFMPLDASLDWFSGKRRIVICDFYVTDLEYLEAEKILERILPDTAKVLCVLERNVVRKDF